MYLESLVNVPGLVLYGSNQFTAHGYDCPDENGTLRLVLVATHPTRKTAFVSRSHAWKTALYRLSETQTTRPCRS